MTYQFEYTGKWWFPDKPEQVFFGHLSSTIEKGIRLQLIDYEFLIDQAPFSENKVTKFPVILGVASDGTKISLANCILQSPSSNLCGNIGNTASVQGFDIEAFLVYLGAHFDNPELVKFNSMTVEYSSLDQWAGISGYRISPKQASLKTGFRMSYKIPIGKKFKITENLSAKVIVFASSSLKRCTEVSVKQKAAIQFNAESAMSVEDFLQVIWTFNNFLTLAVSTPTYPMKIVATTDQAKTLAQNKEIYFPITIVPWHPSWERQLMSQQALDLLSNFMLFGLRDIRRKKTVLKKWFEKRDFLAPVFDLYFGTLYMQGYVSNDFLNLIQALEAYHRRTKKKQNPLPKKLQNKVDTIIAAQRNLKFKEFVSQRLKYSEPGLGKRLDDILRDCPDNILNKIGDKKEFTTKTVFARNYLTHYIDYKTKKKTVETQELIQLSEKLRMLLQFLFLTEIGFSRKYAGTLILRLND